MEDAFAYIRLLLGWERPGDVGLTFVSVAAAVLGSATMMHVSTVAEKMQAYKNARCSTPRLTVDHLGEQKDRRLAMSLLNKRPLYAEVRGRALPLLDYPESSDDTSRLRPVLCISEREEDKSPLGHRTVVGEDHACSEFSLSPLSSSHAADGCPVIVRRGAFEAFSDEETVREIPVTVSLLPRMSPVQLGSKIFSRRVVRFGCDVSVFGHLRLVPGSEADPRLEIVPSSILPCAIVDNRAATDEHVRGWVFERAHADIADQLGNCTTMALITGIVCTIGFLFRMSSRRVHHGLFRDYLISRGPVEEYPSSVKQSIAIRKVDQGQEALRFLPISVEEALEVVGELNIVKPGMKCTSVVEDGIAVEMEVR